MIQTRLFLQSSSKIINLKIKDSKYLDRQVSANNVDPVQTVPEGAV